MTQGTETIWKGVLKRDRTLRKALSDTSVVKSCDDLVNDNPLAGFDTGIAGDGSELGIDDLFASLDTGFTDDESELYETEKAVAIVFKESVDFWLSQSRRALEHALLSMGLTRDVFPTNRPLLVFGSRKTGLTRPEYHQVEVERKGWPSRLYSTKSLTSTAAAKILASSATGTSSMTDPMCFEAETVAAEVPNPLLADDRWIVVWPELESLPEMTEKEPQWGQVRRVVWCVDRDKIGPRDLLDWLSRFWQDTPIRIALFRSTSFVRKEKNEVAQSNVLPKVRRMLEKFDTIKGLPWIVVGP